VITAIINTKTKKEQYYESGALMWETPYVNDKRHGIEKQYYESGALWWEILYTNGVCHSARKFCCFGDSTKHTVAAWKRDAALMMDPMENFL